MVLLIPSHSVAQWLLDRIDQLLEFMGVSKNSLTEEMLYTLIIVLLAIGVGWIIRQAVIGCAKLILRFKPFDIVKELFAHRVISRCSHVIPPLVFIALIPFAFDSNARTLEIIDRLVVVYLLIAIGVAICSVMSFLWTHFDTHKNTRNLPLRGILNVGRGVVWMVILIIAVSVLIDRSPTVLLTGLGAFAAALMLIFKDSILGFVAGIQISQNDMLHVGDWVVVPSTIANGIVIDVSLSVVKVQNWDNTIVMLPPYTLVSTSFQNWRGMQDSGVRLISRSVVIDNKSIKRLTASELDKIAGELPEIADFIASARQKNPVSEGVATVNGTAETNLGLLRAYACRYLLGHPHVANNQQILVRLMSGDAMGTPLQIYCYTTTTDWTAYEAIQSEIVEHIITMCPTFSLQVADCNYIPI